MGHSLQPWSYQSPAVFPKLTSLPSKTGETGFPRPLGAVLVPTRAPYATHKGEHDGSIMSVALMALAVSQWTPQASLSVVRLRAFSAIISP